MIFAAIYGSVVLVVAGASAWWLRGAGDDAWDDRLCRAVTVVALAIGLGGAAADMYQSPFFDWNDVRLAPAVAFARGERGVYAKPGAGAIESSMYPPGCPLAYAPIAFLATPTAAMLAGSALAHAWFFLPALVICLWPGGRRRGGEGWSALAAFLLFVLVMTPLRLSSTLAHADAPALGGGAVACWALATGRPSWGRLWASAALCLWAVACKQTLAPALVAAPLWLWWTAGRGALARFIVALAALGVAALAIANAVFDLEGVWFSAVVIPGNYPWKAGRAEAIAESTIELVTLATPLSAALIFAWLSDRRDDAAKMGAPLWTLLATVGVLLAPLSILGRVKAGGSENTLSPTLYFLALGVAGWWSSAESARRGAWANAMTAVLAALSLLVAPTTAGRLLHYRDRDVCANRSQSAYDFLQKGEPTAYFPCSPLAHLLATGKLVHFYGSIFEWECAGRPAPAEQQQEFTPRNAAIVCFPRGAPIYGAEALRRFFPEHTEKVDIPELGEFDCYRRPTSRE